MILGVKTVSAAVALLLNPLAVVPRVVSAILGRYSWKLTGKFIDRALQVLRVLGCHSAMPICRCQVLEPILDELTKF